MKNTAKQNEMPIGNMDEEESDSNLSDAMGETMPDVDEMTSRSMENEISEKDMLYDVMSESSEHEEMPCDDMENTDQSTILEFSPDMPVQPNEARESTWGRCNSFFPPCADEVREVSEFLAKPEAKMHIQIF